MASTLTPVHPSASASTDSLASSGGGSSGGSSASKESRFNRLIHRLHGSNSSRDLSNMDINNMLASTDSPSTPLRYAPATAAKTTNSPALSDIDDLALERPVFESKFMRELNDTTASTSTHSRPPLAPSYSSPAAVIGYHRPRQSPPNTNNNKENMSISIPSSRELERTRSSPSVVSSPSSSTSSLKQRLVRVASSSSLFGSNATTNKGGATIIDSNTNAENSSTEDSHQQQPLSPTFPNLNHHRKTASLLSNGPSPSPRSRLAASLATTSATAGSSSPSGSTTTTSNTSPSFSKSHAYRHSEDVRQYSRSSPSLEVPITGKTHASSPPLSSSSSPLMRAPSPNLHALSEAQEYEPSSRSGREGFGGSSSLGLGFVGGLNRKRSTDGLSMASTLSLPIREEEDENGVEQQDLQRTVVGEQHHDEDQTAKRNSGTSIEQKNAVDNIASSRPILGERYLSSDRIPLQDSTSTTNNTAAHKSTTPGFPRHAPSSSYSSIYGPSTTSSSATADGSTSMTTVQSQRTGLISSGLSESSRRFRSAFRLNKSRVAGVGQQGASTPGGAAIHANGASNEAAASLMTATGGMTRRAMRVPLRAQRDDDDEEDENGQQQPNDENETPGQVDESASGNSVNNTTLNTTTSPRSQEGNNSTGQKAATSPLSANSSPEVISHDYALRNPTPPGSSSLLQAATHPHDSGNASHIRSRSASPRDGGHATEYQQDNENHIRQERQKENARERAQLVPSHLSSLSLSTGTGAGTARLTVLADKPHTATRPVKVHPVVAHTNGLRPGRATREEVAQAEEREEVEQQKRMSPDASGERASRSHAREASFDAHAHAGRHVRSASQGRMEDLMLVPEHSHSRPASRQQQQAHARQESDSTLVGSVPAHATVGELQERQYRHLPARETQQQQQSQQSLLRDRPVSTQETEEVLINIDSDKENAGAGDWYRQRPNPTKDEKVHPENEKAYLPVLADRPTHATTTDGAMKTRAPLGQVRKPLQEQQANHQQQQQQPIASQGFLPEPRQQGPLPQQHRVGKLSSSSSNGGLGYFPSDRQVIVNDYAVPTKRSGDTPPSNDKDIHQSYPYAHQQPFPKQQQQQEQPHPQGYPYQQHSRAAPPPSRPPAASLPALPSLPLPPSQQNHHDVAVPAQPPAKRAPGTVTVQGKTYTRMGLLGRGGSSKVFRVCDKDHNVYALKKIDLGRGADAETYQAFLNEISLLEALRGHDRIIQLVAHEVNEAKRSLIMVMEIGEIDLNALLQERIAKGAPASMNFVRYMWEQMLEAVNVIHDEGIVHTDLKPANFVLVKGALKLIDFGIAKAIPNDTTNIARDQQIGTANYMSPEALNPHNSAKNGRVMKLGRPSDVWSLGCILYQMVYGHTPFGQIKNLAAKMNAIQTPGYAINFPTHAIPSTIKGEPLPDLAVRVEDDLLAVMKSCLRYDSKRRATIPELLMDPFLRREGSNDTGSRSGEDMDSPAKGREGVSLDLVNAIVKQTLNWSNGRLPSRSDQERFVEAILRQANGMIR